MSDTTATGAGAVSASLAENKYVKELLDILKANGKDSSGLTAILDHVKGMEDFVKQAEGKIADMKSQLDSMKEIQDHPIKTSLQKTIKALEVKIAEIKEQIVQLRIDIAGGCISAINAFKEKGAAALDKLASFFNIKRGLQSIDKSIDASIKLDNKTIVKIEVFSKEYHASGRHLKNMGRVLIGKAPIDTAKESGKLAKVICAPYKAERFCLFGIKKLVNKLIVKLEQLEQKTAAKREERAAAPKPSLAERLKENKERIKQKELEKPVPERAPKSKGLEV